MGPSTGTIQDALLHARFRRGDIAVGRIDAVALRAERIQTAMAMSRAGSPMIRRNTRNISSLSSLHMGTSGIRAHSLKPASARMGTVVMP